MKKIIFNLLALSLASSAHAQVLGPLFENRVNLPSAPAAQPENTPIIELDIHLDPNATPAPPMEPLPMQPHLFHAEPSLAPLKPVPLPTFTYRPDPNPELVELLGKVKPAKITAPEVYFQGGVTDFMNANDVYTEIAPVAKYLLLHPHVRILIRGNVGNPKIPVVGSGEQVWTAPNTDNASETGVPQYQDKTRGEFMILRAEKVKAVFVEFGVNPDQIDTGMGSAEESIENRKVTIEFLR